MMSLLPCKIVLGWVNDSFKWARLDNQDRQGVTVTDSEGNTGKWNAKRVLAILPCQGKPDLNRLQAETTTAMDMIALEEVWSFLLTENGSFTAEYMAELVFSDASPAQIGAMLVTLKLDHLYFKRDRKGLFTPYSQMAVQQKLAEIHRAKQYRTAIENAAHAVQAALNNETYDHAMLDRAVEILQEAVESDGTSREGTDLIKAMGLDDKAPDRAAFSVLQDLGIYGEDENVLLRKYRIKQVFPEDVVVEAGELISGMQAAAGRSLDLVGGSNIVAIDDPWTTEVDDALAIELINDGTYRVHVLIADPGDVVAVDSLVAAEALSRGTTLYLPDKKVLMFPSILSEEALSLNEGSPVPVMDFQCDLTTDGELIDFSIGCGMTKLTGRLSYEQADQLITGEQDKDLMLMHELARKLRQRREHNGALIFTRWETTVRVIDGEIKLFRFFNASPSRVMVSEFMVLVGQMAGDYCRRNNIPAVYRKGGPPDGLEELVDIPRDSMEYQYRLLRRMPRSQLTIHPERHHGLGIDAYVQVTSPLRRYQDFLMHHQLKAHLYGETAMMSSQELMGTFADLESRQATYSMISRQTTRYFLLKYLQNAGTTELTVRVVLHNGNRTLVYLEETGLFSWIKGIVGKREEHMSVRVADLDPRQDILRLKP